MKNGMQTDFPHEEIRKYGCYFLTLCAWVYYAFGIEFSNEKIIEKFNEYKKKRWIGTNCWIVEPVLIFNDLAQRPGYFIYVEHSDRIPSTKRFPCFIDGSPTHFVLGQKNGNEAEIIFDGWNPSAFSRGRKITNYRWFKSI